MRIISRIAPFLVFLTLCGGFSAHAEAQPARAQAYLEARHERANRVLARPAGAARNAELTTILRQLLDIDTLGQAALSSHWDGLTPAHRTRFLNLLRQLVEQSYQRNLEGTLRFDVNYVNAEARGSTVLVQTEARSRTNRRAPPVTIDYTMRREGRSWRVVDIITDGQSLVEGYRGQFNRIIARDGWDALITRMQQRLPSAPAAP